MRKIQPTYRLFTVLVVVLLATACTPVLSRQTGPDTDEIVQQVLTQVQSELEAAEISPALFTEGPGSSTPLDACDLQDTLIQLYARDNPAIVYIVVGNTSSGSGFVYDTQGHIVTNHHVASAGNEYEVVFASGDRFQADLVGSDADSDLAVLQVDNLPEGIQPLPLAEAGDVQVGQFAIAIGSPFGVEGSMSLGIVSGLGRSLRSQRETTALTTYALPEVLQTDAPINPGNSGGPLLNLDGQVIGVNAAIASSSGTNSGVGFAIPVAAVRQIVPSLIKKGEYVYPYLGASFDSEVSLDERDVYGLSQTQGAYVVGLTPGGPADNAGLIAANQQTGHGGDLILALDGNPVVDFGDLNSYLVFHTLVGQTIEITVLRDGERITLPLTLGARP